MLNNNHYLVNLSKIFHLPHSPTAVFPYPEDHLPMEINLLQTSTLQPSDIHILQRRNVVCWYQQETMRCKR